MKKGMLKECLAKQEVLTVTKVVSSERHRQVIKDEKTCYTV